MEVRVCHLKWIAWQSECTEAALDKGFGQNRFPQAIEGQRDLFHWASLPRGILSPCPPNRVSSMVPEFKLHIFISSIWFESANPHQDCFRAWLDFTNPFTAWFSFWTHFIFFCGLPQKSYRYLSSIWLNSANFSSLSDLTRPQTSY